VREVASAVSTEHDARVLHEHFAQLESRKRFGNPLFAAQALI